MKNILFNSLAFCFHYVILLIHSVSKLFMQIQAFFLAGIVRIVTSCFRFLLYLLDKERILHYDALLSQKEIVSELQVLIQVNMLRDHALENSWTQEHTDRINLLGSTLFNACDWTMDDIHAYFGPIINSIPGLSYMVVEEDDEGDENAPVRAH